MKEHALGTTARFKSKQARIMVKPGIFVSLLFFLAFTLLGAGIFWHYASERADRELLAVELLPVLDRSLQLQATQLQSLIWRYEEIYRGDYASDYSTLLSFLRSLCKTQRELIDLVEDDDFSSSELLPVAVASVAAIKSGYATYLHAHAEALGMNEVDINFKIASFQETILATPFLSQSLITQLDDRTSKRLIASALDVVIGTAAWDAASLVSGHTICGINSYFPFFSNPTGPDQDGRVTRKVAVGVSQLDLLPEHVILVVNGDTLALGEDGMADYRYFPKACGGKPITTELTIINALTGKRNGSKGEYLLH